MFNQDWRLRSNRRLARRRLRRPRSGEELRFRIRRLQLDCDTTERMTRIGLLIAMLAAGWRCGAGLGSRQKRINRRGIAKSGHH